MEKKAIVTKALNEFGINENIEPYGNGHINDTFVTDSYDYLIQRINTKVFKKPEELMENIEKVTSFLKEKIVKALDNNDVVCALTSMVFLVAISGKSPEIELNKTLKEIERKAVKLEEENKLHSLVETF